MSGWITVAATCTAGGYEYCYCNRGCGYEEKRNETPALGHNYAQGHICTRCNEVDTSPAKQPEGYIDHCAGGELQFSISGWAYDANAPATSIDIHVYVYQNDGTTRYGDIHIIRADLERPDLATNRGIPTNHGYSATIPIADAGTYKVKAYAIDLNGDGNPQIGATQTITVMGAPVSLADNANNNTTISSYAPTPATSTDGAVTFTGTYSPVSFAANDKSILFVGDANSLYWPNADMNIGACRAYFQLSDPASVREFKLNFDEKEVIASLEVIATLGVNDDSWYTLDGRKLSGKPTKKGLYIYKGNKVVISQE